LLFGSLGLLSTAGLIWILVLLIGSGQSHTLRFIAWSIDDYDLLHAPAIAFAERDIAALESAVSVADSDHANSLPFTQWKELTHRQQAERELDRLATCDDDTLVLYISAHTFFSDGAGDAAGADGTAFVACSGFRLDGGSDRLPLADIFSAIGNSPARNKLVILDSGRWTPPVESGTLVNEYPAEVERLIAELRAERGDLWVFLAHDLCEHAHVSPRDRRSVFGYFLAEGLAGRADADADGKVALDELYRFVRSQVSHWVRRFSFGHLSQTPVLMEAGQGRVSVEELASQEPVVLVELAGRDAVNDERAQSDAPKESTPSPAVIAGPAASADTPTAPTNEAAITDEDADAAPTIDESQSAWEAWDYAPHLWRLRQQVVLRDQWRKFAQAHTDSSAIESMDQREIDERIDERRSAFEATPQSQEQNEFPEIRRAIQIRNRLLFELPHYAELLEVTAEPAYVADKLQGAAQTIEELHDLLYGNTTAVVVGAALEDDCRRIAGTLSGYREDIRRSLGNENTLQMHPALALRLLQTPLLDSSERTALWQLVTAHPSATKAAEGGPAWRLEVVSIDRDAVQPVQDLWDRVIGRAAVEVRLAQLSGDAAQWTELARALASMSDLTGNAEPSKLKPLRQIAARLREHYLAARDLERTTDVSRTSAQQEVLTRLIDPLGARTLDAALQSLRDPFAFLAPLTLQREGKPVLNLVSDGPIALTPGASEPIALRLEAPVGQMPGKIHVDLNYPSSKLRLYGRPQDRDSFDVTIPDAGSRMEFDLPTLSVEPLEADGARHELEITVTAANLRQTLVVAVELPEPSRFDVAVYGLAGTVGRGDAVQINTPHALDERLVEHHVAFRRADENGPHFAVVRLTPFPRGTTPFKLAISNRSITSARRARCTAVALPRDFLARFRARLAEPTVLTLAREQGKEIASVEVSVPPEGEVAFPLFPEPAVPPPAKQASSGQASPEQPVAAPAAAAPTDVDVSGGLLCVIESAAEEQVVWLSTAPLNPRGYLAMTPSFSASDRRLVASFVPRGGAALPAGTTVVEWDQALLDADLFESVRIRDERDLHQAEKLELQAMFREGLSWPVSLVVSVDGYPRALEYELNGAGRVDERVAGRLNLRLRLAEVDDKDQPVRDNQGNLQFLPDGGAFARLPRVIALVEADVPPEGLAEVDYTIRVFISRDESSSAAGPLPIEFRRSVGEFAEFFADRHFHVSLERDEATKEAVLRADVAELTAILNTGAYLGGRIPVVAQIVATDRVTRQARVVKQDRITLLHDDRPPRIVAGVGRYEVPEGSDLTLQISAEDDGASGVGGLELAFARDDAGNLQNPQPMRRAEGLAGRFETVLPAGVVKGGPMFVQAFDQAGNRSQAARIEIIIRPKPEPTQHPDEPQVNSIVGTVAAFGRPEDNIAVTLGGPKAGSFRTGRDGTFRFDDLPPGSYTLNASGSVRGVKYTWPERTVTVAAPPAPPASVLYALK
jgi:hypothetical protein